MMAISNSLVIEVHDAVMLVNMVNDNKTEDLNPDDFITGCTTSDDYQTLARIYYREGHITLG